MVFDSHKNLAIPISGQNLNGTSKTAILQNKALRIMNFQFRDSHSSLLFKSNDILKLEDKIIIENMSFVSKSFNNLLLPIFKSWFTLCSDDHNYQTVSATVALWCSGYHYCITSFN